MFHRFGYEAQFYPTLSRIPLHVRMKLDLTGLRISLKDWLACSFAERGVLCHLPIQSDEEKQVFVGYVEFLARKYSAKPLEVTAAATGALWDAAEIPEPVARKSAACHQSIGIDEWRQWQAHERYGLYKTAVSKSQPEAFFQLLEELRRSERPTEHQKLDGSSSSR
jgi:hypothetical protein